MPKTVLVVDDHSDTRIICRELLSHYGYRVVEAANGDEGISVAKAETPDLILLDFLMPHRNGVEVLTDLRNAEGTAETPIIIFTAAAARVEELLNTPLVTRVLLKPIESAKLLRVVNELIGSPEIPV
jgi:CheY-like chemotaxis protein